MKSRDEIDTEIDAEFARLEALPDSRYVKRFGNMPPTKVWNGSAKDLDRLMERALRRGRALTEDDLLKAQGIKPAPPGTLY